MAETKVCTRCGRDLPLTEFGRKKSSKTGINGWCKACVREAARERRSVYRSAERLIPAEKRCPRCKEMKPAKSFYRAKGARDGLGGYCKPCQKAVVVDWQKRNPEKKKAQDRKQHEKPERKKKVRERLDAWAKKNPQKARESSREAGRRWRARNPEKVRAIQRRRKFGFKANSFEELVEQLGGRCSYCGIEAELTPDHVIPLSKGGPKGIENVVPACLSCNSAKGNKTIVEFVRYLLVKVG